MYIKTANGYVPLWSMSKPERPTYPWDSLRGSGAEHHTEVMAGRNEFEKQEHSKMLGAHYGVSQAEAYAMTYA